jgi:hypothetical protein
MEKYKIDYSETSHFKGIRILFDYLEEGLDYAQQNSIKEVCVWTDGDWSKQIVIFNFLKNRDFIKTFHWIVPLVKKSDITGIYYLSKLENLRWSGAGDFNFDLSKLPQLKELNIGFGDKIENWGNLKQLHRLQIGGVKTENLEFLSGLENLEFLRIIKGTFTSIKGLENCDKLKTIFLQNCNSLVDVKETIQKTKGLENLLLERCKKVDLIGIESLGLKNISVI